MFGSTGPTAFGKSSYSGPTLTKTLVQKLYKIHKKIIQNTKFVYILYTKIVQIKILYDNECTRNLH